MKNKKISFIRVVSSMLIALSMLFTYSSVNAQDALTNELDGLVITYNYSGGNAYNLKFENGTISYRFLNGSKPEAWWGPFSYKATKIENGTYFLSWYEEGYGDHVTLLLNMSEKTIWGSALIISKTKKHLHFQKASISKINR